MFEASRGSGTLPAGYVDVFGLAVAVNDLYHITGELLLPHVHTTSERADRADQAHRPFNTG